MLNTIFQDIRYALRQLRNAPGFALTAVLTLALGIGANIVVFSVLNALVLRPMNFPDAKRMYTVQHAHVSGIIGAIHSYPDYRDLRDRNTTLSALAVYRFVPIGLETSIGTQSILGYEVSGNYFDMLGVQPYLGRFIHPADNVSPKASAYVVLSYNCWRARFNSDKGIIGRVLHLNKVPYTVLGVARQGFGGTERSVWPDLWIPVMNESQIEGYDWMHDRSNLNLFSIGRLKPGISADAATANLNAIAHQMAQEHPKNDAKLSYQLTQPGFVGNVFGSAVKAFLFGVMLLAGLVLLAACTNLGGLFAARAADRARELAIRVALGAGRARLMRQLLMESVVLSLIGGAVGCVAAVGLLQALGQWHPVTEYPVQLVVQPEMRVYFFAFIVSVFAGVLFGAVPLGQVRRLNPNQAIKNSANSMPIGRKWAARDLLLAFQIAICCLLVMSSLVALRGLDRSLHANFGFHPEGVTVADIGLQLVNYSETNAANFQKQLVDTASHLPGVVSAGYAETTPLDIDQSFTNIYTADTSDLSVKNLKFAANRYNISPGYLPTAGTPLLAGRNFTEHDDKKSPLVVIINQTFARKLFGTQDVVGKTLKLSWGGNREIVGVVLDGKYNSLSEGPTPAIFTPILQQPSTFSTLLVRSHRDPLDMAAAIQDAVRHLDPDVPVSNLGSWWDSLSMVLLPARIATAALGVLGGLGILLAMIGIFGLASFTVSRRMKELGIRVALGGSRAQVLRAALHRPMTLLLSGSLLGLGLGIVASKVLASIVYQATPNDPVVLTSVVLTMLLVGALATWIPAQRVLHVDPKEILREQ